MHILITGTARGIGAELARRFSELGHQVTGTTRQDMDVTDETAVKQFADRMAGTAIDLLICNAGIFLDRTSELRSGYPAQQWADTFAANVAGVFHTVQAFLPHVEAAQGKIAIISSQMGSSSTVNGHELVYRASKAAVTNLGLNLSVALAPTPVGIYHPGWVSTDMGGPNADVTPEVSAAGLIKRFEMLSEETTGCFETWDGQVMPI
ncbi:MAG: SDR family NAD(P)-dependent oxidoreductase [Pseudomonadota bacterium]